MTFFRGNNWARWSTFLAFWTFFRRVLPHKFGKYCPNPLNFSLQKHHKDENNICKNKDNEPIFHTVWGVQTLIFLRLWTFFKSNLPPEDEEILWIWCVCLDQNFHLDHKNLVGFGLAPKESKKKRKKEKGIFSESRRNRNFDPLF